jgi:hypothetical protein
MGVLESMTDTTRTVEEINTVEEDGTAICTMGCKSQHRMAGLGV